MSDDVQVIEQEQVSVPEVEAQTDEQVNDQEVSNEPEQKEEPKQEEHKENRIQKRIDKLTREKYELKGRLDALESMMRQPQQQSNQQSSDKPNRDSFTSDSDFFEALTDWKLEQRDVAKSNSANQERQASVEKNWQAKESAATKEYQDYKDVIEDAQDVQINRAAVDAILESDLGPDIRYYLAKHPDEAESTLSMSPARAIAFIGKIEAKIESEKATRKAVPKVSGAPAPIKPVRASSAGSSHFDVNDPKTPIGDWMQTRNKQLRGT